MSAGEVDACDLSVLAVYLGVGDGSWDDESDESIRERVAAYEALAARQVTEPAPAG